MKHFLLLLAIARLASSSRFWAFRAPKFSGLVIPILRRGTAGEAEHRKPSVTALLSVLLLFSGSAAAEASTHRPLEIQVNIAPPYASEFAAYFNDPTAYTITVTNFSEADQEVYLVGELRGLMNGVLVTTTEGYRSAESVIVPAEGTIMLTGEEVANVNEGISIGDLVTMGIPSSDLNVGGHLPEGMYQFCVNAFDFNLEGRQPLSVGCGTLIDIHYGDQLEILEPFEGELVPENPGSVFTMRWFSNIVDPEIGMDLEYEVRLVDLTDNPNIDLDIDLRDGGLQGLFDETLLPLTEEFYNYNATGTDMELEYGHQYAMRVRVIDPFDRIPFANDGYSPVRTFFYGAPPESYQEETQGGEIPDCAADCNYVAAIDDTPASDMTVFSELQIGNFTMTDVDITSGPGAVAATGTGTIMINSLIDFPLAVEFVGLQINQQGRVFNGTVTARDDSDATYELGDLDWKLGLAGNVLPDNEYVDAINRHLTENRMARFLVDGEPQGLPLGFSRQLEGHTFAVGIVSATFTATEADVDIVAFADMRGLHPNMLLPLAARDVCLSPGGFGSEVLLHLTQDLPQEGFDGMTMTLRGETSDDPVDIRYNGSYMELDCDGLRGVAIRGFVDFPRHMLLPDDGNGAVPETGEVQGRFEFTLARNIALEDSQYAYRGPQEDAPPEGTHIMLNLTMDPFQIKGLTGWTFTTTEATLDLSDMENPATIRFPEDYVNSPAVDTGLLWQGFHLKEISVQTPEGMTKNARQTFAIRDLIIDAQPSVSLDAEAFNVIDVATGDLGGWGFALDTFRMTIVQNNLLEGRMVGAVGTPLIGTGEYLDYKALINRNESTGTFEFNAIATPREIVELPMVVAEAALCPNSFIHFTLKEDTTLLTTFLAGQMSVNVQRNLPESLQEQNLVPDVSIRLAEFQLHFNNLDGFVTEGPVPSAFAFGIQIEEDPCGVAYPEEIFEDTDQPDYAYDVSDLGDLLRDGIEPEEGAEEVNSNQEQVSGFPISIDNVDFNFQDTNLDLLVTVGLTLGSDPERGISGTATIGLRSTIKTEGIKIKKLKLDSLWLACVTVGTKERPIDLDFMTLYGGVCMTNDNGGKGFEGELNLTVGENIAIELKAGFGKYGNRDIAPIGTEEHFAWWYLDGMFRMDPGITAGPVTFNGFGGAIYWNVEAPDLTLNIADVMAMADGGAPLEELPGPLTKTFGDRSLAFRTSLSLVNPKTVVVDPEIALRWHATDGLQAITINGDFWVMPMSYEDRDATARLWGATSTGLTFERDAAGKKKVAVVGTNSIYANIIPDVLFGAGPDKLLVSSAFAVGDEDLFQGYGIDHSDRDDTYWFFNVGNPYEGNMGGIKFELPGFNMDNADSDGAGLVGDDENFGGEGGLSVQFYLMTGQNIPGELPEPPGRINELFAIIDEHADGVEKGQDGSSGSFDGGGREDGRSDRDKHSSRTGSGLVMGAHVMASAEVNAVVYAKFALLSGMDMLLFRSREPYNCITTGGESIENVGVNQWYGTGRAYLGLEGALGIKGKILGKEVDAKFMHLVAAVMVEAGGPKPMYLDGRAGVYFNLLNGWIEGSARLKIAVGDPCRPPEGTPFGFPVVLDVSPGETNGGELVDAFIEPAATFSIRLAENPDQPEAGEYLEVLDVTDRLVRRAAYIHEFSITPLGGGERADYSRDTDWPLLRQEGFAAGYKPVSSISGLYEDDEPKEWRLRLVIRGNEQMEDGSWVPIPGETSGVWEEIREIDFTTDTLPEAFTHDQVGLTRPLRYQHFYLQDEGASRGEVNLYANYSDTYFAPTDGSGGAYSYHGIITDAETGEAIAEIPASYSGSDKRLRMNLPTLDNAREYAVLVLKRLRPQSQFSSVVARRETTITSGGFDYGAAADISAEYEVTNAVVNLDDLVSLSEWETIIYEWTFRTSAHNTLSEKMAGVTLRAMPQSGFQQVYIEGDYEGFDAYEIEGKYNRFSEGGGEGPPEILARYQARPLINLMDPFNSTFHDQTSKPLLGGFMETYQGEMAGSGMGIEFAQSTSGLGGQGSGSGFYDEFVWLGDYFDPILNYDWYEEQSLGETLNDDMTTVGLADNAVSAFQQDDRGQQDVRFRYYVIDKVLEDAQRMVDHYEELRDHIFNPEDYGEEIGELVRVVMPDTRAADLAPLEARYLNLINSELLRDDDLSLLSGTIDQVYGDGPNLSGNGLSMSSAATTGVSFGGNDGNAPTISLLLGGGSDSSGNGQFSQSTAEIDADLQDLIPQLYGFSNRLRFRYNRSFALSPSWGSYRMIPVNN